ncbi:MULTISPECIES: TetR/AcrR family transcriptional regulator [unclassified Nocardioides]|uniref:TetR/AcrR family transcriptional regulator n=1 Tax=unclassified Nocardioides TaxID=2615069 RepID=UPI003611F51F
MDESAMSLREQKRWGTSHRITVCAQALTDAHGLDGFTMDELAEAADVSRRTLFNYFPSKTDAVLGAAPEVPDADVDAFRSGGPNGNLLDDLARLARVALAVKSPDRASVQRSRRILAAEPRLLAAAHERFESITQDFTELVLEREGADFDPAGARLLLKLMLCLFDTALVVLVEDETERALVDIFDEQLVLARTLFV